MSADIQIVVNGETRQVAAGLGIAGLLSQLGLSEDRVAIERKKFFRDRNGPRLRFDRVIGTRLFTLSAVGESGYLKEFFYSPFVLSDILSTVPNSISSNPS
jgi:hypothetical protein